jgi:hypothetical protein
MNNDTQDKNDSPQLAEKQAPVSHVMLRKSEVIEILKGLDGLKKKLQVLLKE